MNTNDSVKEYYGKVLQSSGDLKTNACCTAGYPLPSAAGTLEYSSRSRCALLWVWLGAAGVVAGMRILILAAAPVATAFCSPNWWASRICSRCDDRGAAGCGQPPPDWHRQRFGFASSNVAFRKGYIERLDQLGLEEGSFDIIVSNCVINLSPDKEAVLNEAYRPAKPGGGSILGCLRRPACSDRSGAGPSPVRRMPEWCALLE